MGWIPDTDTWVDDGVPLGAAQLTGAFAKRVSVLGLSGSAVTPTSATTPQTLGNIAGRVFDIRAFGAACDGVTDDGPAIQRTVTALAALGGGTAWFPALAILWNSSVLVQTASIKLRGQGWSENVSSGTRIITNSTAAIPLNFTGAACRGSSVRGMSFQQVQPTPAPGWAPTVYPPTIFVFATNGRVTIDDVFCYNCYDFIKCLTSGRLTIGNIYGQPLHCGVSYNGSYDCPQANVIAFWPFWTPDATNAGQAAVQAWMLANGDGIRFFRCDGFQANSLFFFGYHAGVRISAATTTVPNIIHIANPPLVYGNNGAPILNDSNAWATCPGDTPKIFSAALTGAPSVASGATVTLFASHKRTFVEPAGTIATMTLVLPQVHEPNGDLEVCFTQAVTALTVSATGGTTIVGAPSGVAAGKMLRFQFFSNTITIEGANAWYCLS